MNSRFAVAVHILTLLAQSEGEPLTSEYMAGSVNTNPSFIRRLLSALARSGLTRSQMGTGGGALLARPAADVTLLDAYRAVEGEGEVFGLHEQPNPACLVGRNIQAELEQRFEAATRALEAQLARTTIADLTSGIADREARREGSAAA
jgi:Rrf2 family protein